MISVILCTYNGEEYIRQQLDSILSQTKSVDEIIIHDDCSTDATYEIVLDYASRYSQIIVKRNESNIGFRKNFEKALIECQGDYIFFSDQDDVWAKNKVEETVDYLKKTGKYGVFSDGQLIDENGDNINFSLFSVQKLAPYIRAGLLEKYTFEILCLKGNFVTGAALTITKTAKEYILPFRTSQKILHDMWIALKLSELCKLGYIEKPLISYRIHVGQECGLKLEEGTKDPLFDCFEGKGDCGYLLKCRRSTSVISYLCRFGYKERKRVFRTYLFIYRNSLKHSMSKTKYCFLFLLNELYYLANSMIGLRKINIS